MIGQDVVQEIDDLDDVIAEDAHLSFIPLSDPDITTAELDAVDAVLRSPRLSRWRSQPMSAANMRLRCRAARWAF
jgi:hypothetical protein